jgi:excinuclease UvrABC nuclease subunit
MSPPAISPWLSLHRGAKRAAGRYFGPYPNANAVRDTLNLLQKTVSVAVMRGQLFSRAEAVPACNIRSSAAPPLASA